MCAKDNKDFKFDQDVDAEHESSFLPTSKLPAPQLQLHAKTGQTWRHSAQRKIIKKMIFVVTSI